MSRRDVILAISVICVSAAGSADVDKMLQKMSFLPGRVECACMSLLSFSLSVSVSLFLCRLCL